MSCTFRQSVGGAEGGAWAIPEEDASKTKSAPLANAARDFMASLLITALQWLTYTTFPDTKKLKGPWHLRAKPATGAAELPAFACPVLGFSRPEICKLNEYPLPRFLSYVLLILLAGGSASAQTDVPDALKNRPPVAAPTSQIAVAPIEVVRSMSETIND